MSYQRQRGVDITIWPSKDIVDGRGNHQRTIDPDNAFQARTVGIPQRSARAEVPGEQQINVVRLLVATPAENPGMTNVDLWARVFYDGLEWDVVTPPAHHKGSSRHVRHWTIDVRQRPGVPSG